MKRVFDVHIWRRDPPCAWHRDKGYLLNNLLAIKSSTPAFHSITQFASWQKSSAQCFEDDHEDNMQASSQTGGVV